MIEMICFSRASVGRRERKNGREDKTNQSQRSSDEVNTTYESP